MDYDILILGGGIVGCSIAYELSKYSLNIALIEKDYDIADDISMINTAIVYDGMENNEDIMAKLEYNGCKALNGISNNLSVPFKKVGTLMLARNEQEEASLNSIYERAIKRKVEDIAILSGKYIKEIEPNIEIEPKSSIYSKNTGIICPYDLAIAYGEIAFDNGVKFKLEEEVMDIEKTTKGYRVVTNKNKFTCKIVINTTPRENYSINFDKKDENLRALGNVRYLLLDKSFNIKLSNILFIKNDKDEKVIIAPSIQGSTVVYMYSKDAIEYDHFFKEIMGIFKDVDLKYARNFFESDFYENKIIIDDNYIEEGYIKISGKNYAEVTMTPYIAEKVCDTIVNKLKCKANKDFNGRRREIYKFKDLTDEEKIEVIKLNKKYGKIICHCQKVTEGEIVDAIRRPLGARTIEGIKRRTGIGLGSCQGASCLNKIVAIMARETNKKITDIVKDSKKSKIVLSRIKEFDEV
ncbi:NAD(P)/FAD-dependent oxidoreductase [Haloimpatiens sp. FM7315]|uniref:NAD(P)/FAD-dependent oxidoreductase n=1 Tax=Haloimpatiens sp. FM7315 TaxID=3298609 RepID=UPI0035A3AED0